MVYNKVAEYAKRGVIENYRDIVCQPLIDIHCCLCTCAVAIHFLYFVTIAHKLLPVPGHIIPVLMPEFSLIDLETPGEETERSFFTHIFHAITMYLYTQYLFKQDLLIF